MKWHKRNHGKTLERARPLSLELRGALATVEDLIYARMGAAAEDIRWLAGMLGVSARKCRSILDELIDKAIIYRVEGGGLMTQDCAEWLAEREIAVAQCAAAGESSGRSRRKSAAKTKDNSRHVSASAESDQAKSTTCANARSQELEGERDKQQAAAVDIAAREAVAPAALRPSPRDEGTTQRAIELHRAIAGKFGSEVDSWGHEFGTVLGWVERGWAAHVLPAIDRVLARRKGQLPNSWRYFTEAIAESAKAGGTGPPLAAAAGPDFDLAVKGLVMTMKAQAKKGRTELPEWAWPRSLGPKPGEKGCRVPADILAKYGLAKAA